MKQSEWKIVVVEDETDSMELVNGILEHHGIYFLGATTGEEALQLLQSIIPTLIIIDLALPGIDGWSILKKLKRNPAFVDVPCVAMTAYHSAELANKAIEEGFDAYFSKPLDATSFVRELEGIINN